MKNAQNVSRRRRVPTIEPSPSWTNDLVLKSYMGGGAFNGFIKISFKASSQSRPSDSSVFTVGFDEVTPTPRAYNSQEHEEILHPAHYKSLQDVQHRNLIKYQNIQDRKFSLRELQALISLPISDEKGSIYVRSLLGLAAHCEAASLESPSIFCMHSQLGGPSLRDWSILQNTEKAKYSVNNTGRLKAPPLYLFKLQIVDDIQQGLGFLHTKGFLHKDLTPENIRFATDAFEFPVTLSNFGLNLKVKRSSFRYSHYDAPELEVDSSSIWSDIFSLGVVIWELFQEIPLGDMRRHLLSLFATRPTGPFGVVKRDPIVYNLDLLVGNYISKDARQRNKSKQGFPLKLLLLQPSTTLRFPFLYGGLAKGANEVFLGRQVEVDQALKAILNPRFNKMLEIRGGLKTGKTSLVRKIVSKLTDLKINIVIAPEEDLFMEKLWFSIFQTGPATAVAVADHLSCILSNRQEQRWAFVWDMNFSTRNSSLISSLNHLISKFPPDGNLAPFVIFTSVEQYDPLLICSKHVELITINDWQIDWIAQGLGNNLRLDTPMTLAKRVDLLRASKDRMDRECEALHPLLVQEYGEDHEMTEFVKKLIPPTVITLDDD